MSGADYLVLAFFAGGIVFAATRLPAIWRGRARFGRVPTWWFWGEALWRGWQRAVPLAVAFGIYFVPIFVGAQALHTREPNDLGLYVPLWFAALALGGLFLFLALFVSIVLVNKPKMIVPPYLRDEPGALGRLLGRRENGGERSA